MHYIIKHMAPSSIAPLLRRLAPQYGIDPAAAIAVALGEGGLVNRQDDVGDLAGGGSYGPFQLYAKGALPRQYVGNARAADAFAWSPEGIKYALSRMRAAGASGLRGPSAVEAIIRKFERPADPNKSVRLALCRLGTIPSGSVAQQAEQGAFNPEVAGSIPVASTPNGSSRRDAFGGDRRSFILQGLIRGDSPLSLLEALPGMRGAGSLSPVRGTERPGVRAEPSGFSPPVKSVPGARGFSELIYDPVGSVFDGVASNKPYGGHGNHLHFASRNPQVVLRGIALAQQLGLNVRENPYTDPVDPVHTKNSHHYQVFPGKYNGRSLGQALDVSGNPQRLKTLYQRLAALK
jgi:hypothetical protein